MSNPNPKPKPKPNPRVFLDISINKGPPGRLVIELFADVVPKTAENFRALCVGDRGIGIHTGKPLHYKGCIFYDITKGFFAEAGDFSNQNGTGGESIYGKTFPDENFKLRHSGPGILSMASGGPNRNGSQFLLTFSRRGSLDGFHVVFGKVIRGLDTLEDIKQMGTGSGKPKGQVEITDCGEISQDKKSNVIESDIPESSSVRKEDESAALKNNVLVTASDDREVTVEKPHQHSDDPRKPNPRVFLDISIDKSPPQRLVIELFADVVPKTAENFRALCVGDKGNGIKTGKPLHYKGCVFHQIIKGFFAQGGDISNQKGTGGESIYGETFPDENFKLVHTGRGILSMANDGWNTNGSRFYITFNRQLFLDGYNVVFGKVIEGMETLQNIEELGTNSGTPLGPVVITDCGEIPLDVIKSGKNELKRKKETDLEANEKPEDISSKRKSKGPMQPKPWSKCYWQTGFESWTG